MRVFIEENSKVCRNICKKVFDFSYEGILGKRENKPCLSKLKNSFMKLPLISRDILHAFLMTSRFSFNAASDFVRITVNSFRVKGYNKWFTVILAAGSWFSYVQEE